MDDFDLDSLNPQPNVPASFVPAKSGETFKLGTLTIRILESGEHTGEQLLFSATWNRYLRMFRQPSWCMYRDYLIGQW